MTSLRGELVQAKNSVFGDRVFYVADGIRHWVSDSDWLGENGFKWPDDVKNVSEKVILDTGLGRPATRRWKVDPAGVWPVVDQGSLREIGCSFLRGAGVEFGAASNPLPIPLELEVSYADHMTYEELIKNMYPGQSEISMVRPHFQMAIDKLEALPHKYDFIALAHVIEHVRDPIGTIISASKKLNPGGQLILFVPDMTQTFDRERKLTTLNHLLTDYFAPSRVRDSEHFKEFYSKAFAAGREFENVWMKAWSDEFPIHYHTWTYDSFLTMVKWIMASHRKYSECFSHETCGNEFCIILRMDS